MTGDGEALLRAIGENPAEDTPRLVYADWLQENGQPERAEFIRRQIRHAGSDKAWPLAADRAFLKGDVPAIAGVVWGEWHARGFRTAVTFSSMKAVKAHADTVFASCPVADVTVKRMQPLTVSPLLAMPWVERITAMRLAGNVGAVGAGAIARSPALKKLETLDLTGAQMTDSALKTLAAAHLPNLQRLCLDNNRGVTEAGLNELLKSATLKKLRGVDGVRWTLLPMTNPLRIYTAFYERFPESR